MATTAKAVWLDGSMTTLEHASVPLTSNAIQRGSLVFDLGSFHPTPDGVALFRAREHVARFLASTKLIGLELGHDEAALLEAARAVVRANGIEEGMIRWTAVFTAPEPDLVPREPSARVMISVHTLQDPPRTTGMRVSIFDDARKAPRDVMPPEAKVAASYLGPMLARRRAMAEGSDEVILLDRDGFVAEAPTANVFAVLRGAVWTPPLGSILAGVTRDCVLAVARAEGLEVREEKMSVKDLAGAEEAFLTATSLPLGPIGWVNGRALRHDIGPVTTRLKDRIVAIQHGEDHPEWRLSVSA
jgi:branched-chain amino acid aminotransferase